MGRIHMGHEMPQNMVCNLLKFLMLCYRIILYKTYLIKKVYFYYVQKQVQHKI